MRRILVPIDFSEEISNSIHYALKIAEKIGAKVCFFHANHIPVISTDAPFSVYEAASETGEKFAMEKLESLKEEWLNRLNLTGKLDVENLVELGFAVEEILATVEKKNIDLIIMASKGAKGLSKAFFGTNTERIIQTSNCPVLLIPEDCTYKDFSTILLASDYSKINSPKTLLPLEDIARAYHSEILIFNAQNEKEHVPTYEEAIEGLDLEGKLAQINHKYFFSENENTIEAIDDFIEENKPDLLVLLPHPHTFFEKIFTKSITSEFAFHTRIPLLSLPDVNEIKTR